MLNMCWWMNQQMKFHASNISTWNTMKMKFPPGKSRIMPPSPKGTQVPFPEPVSMLRFKGNKVAVWIQDANQMTLKRVYPELPGWSHWETEKCSQRKICDDKGRVREMLCGWFWSWRKGTVCQGTWAASKNWTWQWNILSPRDSKKEYSPVDVAFRSVKSASDF